jgi:hypothetical protein
MGHIRLGALPRTRRWKEVIDLIGCGASSAAVAAATLDAVEEDLAKAANDPGLKRAFWLLSQIPDAARAGDFAAALRDLGLSVSDRPSAADLTAAFTEAVDRHIESKKARTGPGELAQLAAAETLSGFLRDRASTLFGSTPDDVRMELRKVATEVQFGRLARDFFARFTERYLTYYVSKELPQHVGAGRRFGSLEEQKAFTSALELHCKQASKIVESFAGGWYSKARFEKDLTEERTTKFLGYALKKIRGELRRGAAE